MRTTKSAARILVSTAMLLALSGTARAQAPLPGSDKVAAQALFEDGRKLVDAGKYAEACPKFADSERLDPSPSTLLNLANCWERLGRSATAWATYKEAESVANAAKRQDYMTAAQRHADALAPKLSRLTINVQEPSAGLQVKRDGTLVGSAEWGSAIPLDGGSHAIEASAPGYKRWATRVDVTRDGAQLTITVPPLEPLPAEPPPTPPALAPANTDVASAPPPPPTPPAETGTRGSMQRTAGIVVAGAGVVGLGVSGALALIANSKKQDSLKNCHPGPDVCDSPSAVSERDDALFMGDAASVALGIGAAAVVAGAVLWFAAPTGTSARSGSAARVAIVPTVGGAVVKGTW